MTTIFSCKTTKDVVYFNNQPEGEFAISNPLSQQPIVANDILSISVSSLNPEASAVFNGATNSAKTTTSYLVEKDGSIQFPVLGKIQTAGLTKAQLTDLIRNTLIEKKLLLDPIVTINYLNFRVTVLGEVSKPMVVPVPNEKISLLEALGMAGDLTIYARRDNVLLIREENGKRLIKRINLNASDLFTSEYYYLKSNDIVYAEPNKTKVFSTSNTRQILPIIFSGISLLALVVYRLR
ncbi:MAG: polysaccharide biosynthesis/export family protein [Ginsengibacter sp.]